MKKNEDQRKNQPTQTESTSGAPARPVPFHFDMQRFEKKVVFATGAARGLCFAIVQRFLREGAFVLAFDLREDSLAAAAAAWGAGDRVLTHAGDVRDRASVQAAVDAAVARWGTIHVLANVAGICREDNFLEMDPAEWQRIIDINLTGVFNVAQLVARQMAKTGGGSVINMASKNGIAAEVKCKPVMLEG
jgi:NAD(P)-dependent dehydrogenase (short-subunit alcohol dehydrogenase family)